MTTLIEAAAKKLMTAIALDRHDVGDWPNDSRDAHETLEQAIAQELASQSASTNEPLRSCGSCKNFSTQSLTGGAKCVACKAFNNWEPKP
mgnify:CR=1 FL=1